MACAECGEADAAVAKVMRECNLSNPRLVRVIRAAMETQRAKSDAPPDWNAIAELMIERQRLFVGDADLMRHSVGPRKFFAEGYWIDRELWPYDQAKIRDLRRRL
jgi:hypothetical protein